MTRKLLRRALPLALAALAFAAVSAAPAFAGTQVVHGYDEHCSDTSTPATSGPCAYSKKVVDYLRAGAPDPAKPLLLVDCDGGLVSDLTGAHSGTMPAHTQVCGLDPLPALSTSDYSAVLVGYDDASGGVLNDETANIAAFFNEGGGVGLWDAGYAAEDYDFLPLDVTWLDSNGSSDYTVTAEGAAAPPDGLGLVEFDVDDDCCQHSRFADPDASSPLKVGVRDYENKATLLFGRADRRAPVSASSGCVSAEAVAVGVTDEGNGSGAKSVTYTVDGGAEQSAATDASGNALIPVTPGSHTIAYRGVDGAGNAEAAGNSITVECASARRPDTQDPGVRLLGVPKRSCVEKGFKPRVKVGDASGLKSVVVYLDGEAISTKEYTGTLRALYRVTVRAKALEAGRHRLTVKATDEDGNTRRVTKRFGRC